MKSKIGKIFVVCMYILFTTLGVSHAIPNEYIANYNINSNRSGILEILTKIEAYRKTGKAIPAEVFSVLYRDFRAVRSYLPQDPSYKVVYEQCDITTDDLSRGFSYDKFTSFLDQCYEPISRITSEINNKYTISPLIQASPDNGPAPLNVTFDARGSKDPSNDTIPSNNYYRYYKDTQGVTRAIGQGPVLNHTFDQAGNYVIHSTIRSVNNNKGVQDGEAVINVNVSPQSANIAVYANGKRMGEDGYVKVGTTEATNGITLDGSATTPNGGRKIISHIRNITSSNGYKNQISSEGSPSVAKFVLPGDGIYTVNLSVIDNEKNNIGKSYQLVVSDPVAIIKQNPEYGTTSTNFSFDAGNSYSVASKIKLYKREIFDTNAQLIDTIQSKQISKKFIKPGTYSIKLTVYDEFGNNNIENTKLIVDSTDPIAQYTSTPTQSRANPSQYILDAGNTFDVDVGNNFDSLTYDWKISSNTAKIEQSYDNNKKVLISFNEKGTYKVTLSARDSFGKISEITKDFAISSTIRPVIIASPGATTRGKSIKFTTTTNKPIVSYRRDFGDNTSKSTTDSATFHEYKTAGIYLVKLYVTTSNLEENSIQLPMFIGEVNKPIAVYDIVNSNQQSLIADQICTVPEGDKAAYNIDRYEQIEVNTSQSLNTKGEKNTINTYFKPQNDSIFKGANLKYRFSDVGCQYIDMIVEDQNESTMDKKRIYFKVRNSLPVLNNVVISFPQYNNEAGVGFMQNKLQDPSFNQYDPLAVRVMADNPIDKDGQISFFTWYYYKTDNPDRLLDIKITPGNINGVIFNISREAGEYTFGVKMSDNDGGEKTSEEIIGRGPVVFIQPKGSESNNIPIVTLKASASTAKVGENVKFTTTSKILSDKPDFKANRIFKYDFDGDGNFDLTTTEDVVNYAYTQPSSDKGFTPKVKVIYKDKAGESLADTISIKKGLKPQFDYIINDKSIYILDTSLGITENTKVEYCMDIKKCSNAEYIVKLDNNNRFFKFDYSDYGKFLIKLTADDDFGNTENFTQIIELTKPTTIKYIDIVSFPQITKSEDGEIIQVGKILDNKVNIYIQSNNSGSKCSISAVVGSQNKEYKCGELNTIQFDDDQEIGYINIKYDNDKGPVDRQIKVILIDNQYVVPEKYITYAKQIDEIRSTIAGKEDYKILDEDLSVLRKALGDRTAMNDVIPDITNEVNTISGTKTEVDYAKINKLISNLSDRSTQAILGANDYEQAKGDIKSVVSTNIQEKVSEAFDKIDSANGDKDQIYNQMTGILGLVKDEVTNGSMDSSDFELIKTQICQIANYKEIPTETCNNIDLKPVSTGAVTQEPTTTVDQTNNPSGGNSVLRAIIKIIIWIIGIIIILFIGGVIYYAIKKKREQTVANAANAPSAGA